MVTLSSLLFGAAVGFSAPAPQSAPPPSSATPAAPAQPIVQVIVHTGPAPAPTPKAETVADPFRARRPDHPRALASKQAKASRAKREAKLLDPFAQHSLVAHETRPVQRAAPRDPFSAPAPAESAASRRAPAGRGQPLPRRSDEGLIDPFAS